MFTGNGWSKKLRRTEGASVICRFGRDRSGATAVEFAILALPFFLLLFAILESCIAFAAQQVMTNATEDVARQFRTGQLRPEDVEKDPDLVHDLICRRIDVMVASDCPGLEVDLQAFDTFEKAAQLRIRFTADGDIDTSGFGMEPGYSMSKNMLRVFYRWPVMTDIMRKSMSNLPDGKTLLFATSTWQNEPY